MVKKRGGGGAKLGWEDCCAHMCAYHDWRSCGGLWVLWLERGGEYMDGREWGIVVLVKVKLFCMRCCWYVEWMSGGFVYN